MALGGFDDTEGLAYIGSNRFVITEERMRNAYLSEYAGGSAGFRSQMPSVSLGSETGNIGIEGISYDPRSHSFLTVKEKSPQEINSNMIDFTSGTASVNSLFDPGLLGMNDLSDIQVLSTVSSLAGTNDADNRLIYSQESALLLETDRQGNILSRFDFSALSGSGEGVTIDSDGNIYVVAGNGNNPQMFVLSPSAVPVPGTILLLGAGLMGLAGIRRKEA